MRKILILFACSLISLVSLGQERSIKVEWDDKGQKKGSNVDSESHSQTIGFNKDRQQITTRWKDVGFAKSRSLRVFDVIFNDLTQIDKERIDLAKIPNELRYDIGSSDARGVVYTTLRMSPVINRNGVLKKVVSFKIDYDYGSTASRFQSLPISNSVLATGDWFKFKVEKTGVHRITKQFLNDLGMNTNSVDPRTIKVYGHGGKPLPLLNRDNLALDLPETAIQFIGEEDGSFDNGDQILFYATNVDAFSALSLEENETNLNPYSDESFYYVTSGGDLGKRIQPMLEPSDNPTLIIDRFHDYQFHEEDDFSPAKVGRRWFGNRFDIESEQSYDFNFPNMVANEPMEVTIKAAAVSSSPTSIAVTINSTSVNPMNLGAVTAGSTTLLSRATFSQDIPPSGDNVVIDLAYNNSGNPSSVAYLDYISIEAVRQLSGVSEQFVFRNNDVGGASGTGEYQITNASEISQIWDVTSPGEVAFKENADNAGAISFKATLGEVRTYVAVNPNDYFSPVRTSSSRVVNQNLKGSIMSDGSGNFQDVDYLIVTPPFLLQPALRLANHHINVTGLRVKVATTDKIYEEFSSGKQDIGAIRNLVRYIYENGSSDADRIKYLCLFGDTSVDLKDRLPNNNNIVPSFHTTSSSNSLDSFVSDDYFGMMSLPNSTDPVGDGSVRQRDGLDIAVGRMLADNVILANAVVEKTINYSLKASFGNWRNNLVLISDDVDERFEYEDLELTLDEIGDRITEEKPFVNVKKIHSDAFQQETSAGGDRYPKVNEQVVNDIELGALIVNYFGHGGEDGLASEFIFTKETGTNLKNKDRYPCIVTVTCEFTKFDNPLRITGGELTFWNAEGGAVSLITTTRSILVSTGVDINRELAEELYGFGREVPLPPAEGLRLIKNESSAPDKRVVFYIGDPALELAFPKQSVRVTTLNDEPIQQSNVVLEALSKVKLGGEVVDSQGNVITNYNGILEAKVFDKDVQRQTLGNDGTRDFDLPNGEPGPILILDFKTLGEGLFNGKATVVNGKFEFEFVVPRDIQIPVGQGKVSLYAQRNNVLEDQTGFSLDIQVGGLNEDAPADNQGPTINLFMNDLSFVSGGITNDSPILIAQLEDENGINTASGIGHDIVAILDGDETNPFVLNEYYQAEVDDFTEGTANYTLRDLEEGLHTLTLKAWDVYNNSSTAEIQFVVFGDNKLEVRRVLNYPNPFVNYTEFWFEHNRPLEMLDVQVQIFTITGKVVKTINTSVMTSGGPPRDIVWDGTDDFGGKIGKGVYVYKLTVKSPLINQQVEKYEKLVIL
ncbi:MAG: type IX secretion system sortase PorU [Bacteroidetes bacterium]|nr:type IX secretion system sortase PorU [Bacteroidota bacterium]